MGFAVSVAQFFGRYRISVNKIPHCGNAVISNSTMCNVCVFKPTFLRQCRILPDFLQDNGGKNGQKITRLCDINVHDRIM